MRELVQGIEKKPAATKAHYKLCRVIEAKIALDYLYPSRAKKNPRYWLATGIPCIL